MTVLTLGVIILAAEVSGILVSPWCFLIILLAAPLFITNNKDGDPYHG